jgi:hypothetical protein
MRNLQGCKRLQKPKKMTTNSDSTDRGPVDFVLFGLAFIGFLVGLSGVILASLSAAVGGLLLMLISIGALGARSGPNG